MHMFTLYKPNSKNLGCAFSFKIGVHGKDKEPCIYVNAIQQHSWNEKTRNGSFSENAKNPDKTITFKLNEIEAAGLIYAVSEYVEYKAFHSYEENKTTINFKPYSKQDGTKAFSLSVVKNSALKFGIGFEMSEAYLLKAFCEKVLNELFEYRINSQKQNN